MNGRTKKQAVRFFPASPIQLHFLTLTIRLKGDLSKYKSSFRTTTNHNLASEAWSLCLLCIRFNYSISLELELELGRWAADCLHQWSVDYWWLLLLLAALFVCSILCFMLKDWLTDSDGLTAVAVYFDMHPIMCGDFYFFISWFDFDRALNRP